MDEEALDKKYHLGLENRPHINLCNWGSRGSQSRWGFGK